MEPPLTGSFPYFGDEYHHRLRLKDHLWNGQMEYSPARTSHTLEMEAFYVFSSGTDEGGSSPNLQLGPNRTHNKTEEERLKIWKVDSSVMEIWYVISNK